MPMLTVIILQYRPDFAALRRTLASLAMQTTRDFEVVVADDGSEQDYFAETKAYLEGYGIHPAAFVKAEKNGGTVKNLLGGLRRSTGRWVFAPSPGDYLYDADTLRWLLETLQRDEPRVGFGGLAAYCEKAGIPCQLPGDTPFDKAPYQPGRYDAARAKRNMLLYDDGICGAALFYERELLENTLPPAKPVCCATGAPCLPCCANSIPMTAWCALPGSITTTTVASPAWCAG